VVLGHLTVTAAGHRLLRDRLPVVSRMSVGLLILGAYLPDLVDKPLNLVAGLSGRAYGHALTTQLAVFGVAWLLAPSLRRLVLPLAAGAALHLAQDWVGAAVLFAPLLGPIPPAPPWGFLQAAGRFYGGGGPLVWLEIAAIVYWLAVGIRRVAGLGDRAPAKEPSDRTGSGARRSALGSAAPPRGPLLRGGLVGERDRRGGSPRPPRRTTNT